MAIKCSAETTITNQIDATDLIMWYYATTLTTKPLSPSTTSASAAPTGWSLIEPTITSASDLSKYIYECLQIVWGDGTCSWGDVQLSASFEAAKQAYNLAHSTASIFTTFEQTHNKTLVDTVNESSSAITTLTESHQYGGINLLSNTKSIDSSSAPYTNSNISLYSNQAPIDGESFYYCSGPKYFQINFPTLINNQKYTLSFDISRSSNSQPVFVKIDGTETNIGTAAATTWTRLSHTFTASASTTNAQIRVAFDSTSSNNTYIAAIRHIKLEQGSLVTPWEYSSNDISTLSNTVNTVSQTADSNSSTISNLTQTLGTNANGTTKTDDIVHQVSNINQDLNGITTRVGKTEIALKGNYAVSSTAKGTANKQATISPTLANYELVQGAAITVKFTTENTAANPTLNINSTGAKPIKTYSGAALSENEYKWDAGSTMTFVYDGTNWCIQDSTELTRIKNNETLINQTANNVLIKATESDTTVAQGGQHLIQSLINVAPNGIKISADKVDIEGAAIFSENGYLSQDNINAINNESQTIYIQAVSGTSSVSGTTTWVTNTGESVTQDAANLTPVWTIKRPIYRTNYPVLFVATQYKTIDGTVTCTTPLKDDTITVIDAGHITTGTIDASNITVTNLNADNITTGTINGQRIGVGSLSLDKLAEDVYTETEVDNIVDNLQTQIDGAIETWTGTNVPTLNNTPANTWTTDSIKDTHVGDVYFVVNDQSQQNGYNYRFTKITSNGTSTYSWQLIKDNDVTNALQRLTTAEGKIGNIETFDSTVSSYMTNTDNEITSIKSAATTLSGRVDTAEGTLATKVDTSTFNTLSQTVEGNTQSISSLNTTITTKADSSTVSALQTQTNTISDTVDGHTQSITSLNNTVATKADGSEVTTLSNNLSSLQQDVNGFKTTVSETYTTKEEFENLEIGGRNLIPSSVFTNVGIDGSTRELGPVGLTVIHSNFNLDGKYIWNVFEPETQYTFRVGALATDPSVQESTKIGARFYFRYTDGTTDIMSFYYGVTSVRYQTMTSQAGKTVERFTATYSKAGTTWTFYEMKLEKGNKATDWTPAPEDIETRVSSAESSITQNAQNIELKVSKDGVISSINQSAETVKIQASRVEIDGTAVFNAIKSSTDAAYDVKGAAATAKSEAISAAASDATSKANAAQSAAISTAAADATSKANAAEANAKTYAEGQADVVNSALETYKTTTNSTLTSLQNQVDGQIEAWYKSVDPTGSNEPASTWTTDALKARHIGDLYYNVTNGHSWRWMQSGNTYEWQQIPDSDAAAALAVAQNAQSLANSKRRIFTSTPTVPYDVGDLWVDGTSIKYANASKTDSQTYSESDWAVTATDDSLAQTALNAAGVVQDNLNSARTWYAECDDAAATVAKVATITPITEDFVLTVGSVVYIKFAITNSAAVASITLNVNNTGAKRIQYTASGGNVANLPAVGYLVANRVYQFIYDGTYWVLQYNYNSNTTYNLGQNLYYNTLKAKSAIAAETIIVGDADGYTQAQAGVTFDLSYPILWCTKAIAVNGTNYANIYTSIQDRNLKTYYSSFQGTARAMVYLVGTVSGNTITIDSDILTSTEPTTEDGKIYIPIGRHGNQYVYASAPAYFFFDCQTTTLFAYLDGEFRQVTPTEIVSTHRIYYRTATANSSLAAPTTWIEEATGNVYNQWTTKVPPLAASTASGQTKYLYLYTCEQRKRLDGTTVCTKVLLDENTTVIDGGSIITNSITANQIAAGTITTDKLNATDINASNTLTIGALDSNTQGAILNSNISVGGSNLLLGTKDFSGWYTNAPTVCIFGDGVCTYMGVSTKQWHYLGSPCIEFASVEGSDITLSFDMRSDDYESLPDGVYPCSQLYLKSAGPQATNYTYRCKTTPARTPNVTGEWTRFSYTFESISLADFTQSFSSADAPWLCVSLWFYQLQSVQLRRFKLERGNKATDWSPAPEDVDANISEAAKTATNYITADLTGIKIHMSDSPTTYQHQSSTATTYYVNDNKRAEVSANGLEVFDGTHGSEESVAAFGTVARLGKTTGNKVIADSTGVHIYNVQGSQISQVAEFGQAPGESTTTILSDEPEIGTSYPVPSNAIRDISIMLDDQTLVEDTDYTLSSSIVTLLESATVTGILDDSSSGGEESPEDVGTHSLTCEYTASAGVGLAIGASVTRPGLDVAERAVFRHPSFVEAIHGTANADTGYRASRTDTGIQVFCGIGIGGVNHGVYSHVLNRWLINADRNTVHVAPHTVTDGNINIKSKYVYATTPSASKGNGWGHSLQYLDTAGDLVGVVKAYSLTTGEKGIQLQATRNIGSTTYNNGIRFGVDTSGNLKLAFSGGGRLLWRQALGFDSGDVASSYGGSDNAPKNAYRDIPVTFNFTHTYAPHVVATFSTGSTGVTMGGLSLSVHSITTTGCKVRIYNNTNDTRNPALKWVAID